MKRLTALRPYFFNKTSLFLVILGLISLGGSMLMKESTVYGLGLSNDSAAYIAGARSIMSGEGYIDSWLESTPDPITHYPPMFSLLLAGLGLLTGLDPLRGARFLNILVYGANILVMGFLGWRMTRSRAAGIFLAVLFFLNGPLFRVSAYALSEPIFLFFGLLSFLVFSLYFERNRKKWLVLTGILVGFACLTRYTGLALFATFAAVICIIPKSLKERGSLLFHLVVGSFPWFLAWLVRNAIVAGNATNRVIGWHPVGLKKIDYGVKRLSYLFVPIEKWRRFLESETVVFESLVLVIGIMILAWLFVTWRRCALKKTADPSKLNLIAVLSGVYIFAYLSAMLASMSMYDPATRFQDRILAPVIIALQILFAAVVAWIWRSRSGFYRAAAAGIAAVMLIMSGVYLWQVSGDIRINGLGYESWRWRDSESIHFLKQLPEEIYVYTNSPPAVYLNTGRAARFMPRVYNRGEDVPAEIEGLDQFVKEIWQGEAVLVVFDTNNIDRDSSVYVNLELVTADLKLYKNFGDDLVFMGRP
ncbi:MAG: phospholipid carrier-dependent glycosyltransferase [Anaerolineales bacterium]|nr:phospholipid carrier-dependent glycosyltransferase [Anaerolineales bacterium]